MCATRASESSTPRRRVRTPAVAGSFYARDRRALEAQIAGSFEPPRGPGRLAPVASSEHRSRPTVAGVVPHAGLPFSGPIAAHFFAQVQREAVPATVLALGVNHHGLGRKFAVSDETWSTPLGEVEPDLDLVEALVGGPIERDAAAHRREHSLEVELPFLQTIYPPGSFRWVALQVTFAPLRELLEVGRRVQQAVKGRDVLLLASSDLSHYLPREEARRVDGRALEALLTQDPTALYERVVGEDISMCGIAPTTALLAALRGSAGGLQLLARGDSADEEPMDDVVGYASLRFAPKA